MYPSPLAMYPSPLAMYPSPLRASLGGNDLSSYVMNEILYTQSSILIIGILFTSSVLAIEAGYRFGRRAHATANPATSAHVAAIQAALLGVLALLLGFTFSLALQRYDSRSEAVVDEANAIGTAYLRAQLLPPSVRGDVQMLLRVYLEGRVQESLIPLSKRTERQVLLAQAGQEQAALWGYALQAAGEDANPVTSGLFIQSLNDLFDSFGRRNAALDRHVPEIVMLLLYGAFLMTWSIVGYAAGIAGHRPSAIAYVMLVLLLVVIFIIVDLDRPRRGLIEIDHASLTALQLSINSEQTMKTANPSNSVAARPAYVTALEAAYGAPSQAGFGSAVFYEPLGADDSLTDAALAKYKYFVGDLWERWGEDAWMGPWKEVYTRKPGAKPDIVAELRGIADPDAAISAPMILDVVQDAEGARAALAAAFDDPAVTELRVFNLGDGGAMSGILVAGRRGETSDATFLVFLLD